MRFYSSEYHNLSDINKYLNCAYVYGTRTLLTAQVY